jgi:hypothetical protein
VLSEQVTTAARHASERGIVLGTLRTEAVPRIALHDRLGGERGLDLSRAGGHRAKSGPKWGSWARRTPRSIAVSKRVDEPDEGDYIGSVERLDAGLGASRLADPQNDRMDRWRARPIGPKRVSRARLGVQPSRPAVSPRAPAVSLTPQRDAGRIRCTIGGAGPCSSLRASDRGLRPCRSTA